MNISYHSKNPDIDIYIMDLKIPGMDGFEDIFSPFNLINGIK
jgi:DNA-binding response OmpR family regulator